MRRQILFRYSSAEFLGRKAYRLILLHRDEGVRLMLKRIEFARAPMKFSRSNFMRIRQPLNSARSSNKSIKLSFKFRLSASNGNFICKIGEVQI